MAWGTGARAQGQDLSTASGQTGLHSEAEQQENATSGDRDDTRRDRVVQTAAILVLEPIFEADLQPEQYAYRAGTNALDAVAAVNRLINFGHTAVVDADLRGYFDEIPHGPLMKSVARRITDRRILHLIKVWIEAPVEETDDRGRKYRTTRNRDQHRGIPQGSPISPLLSNLYM